MQVNLNHTQFTIHKTNFRFYLFIFKRIRQVIMGTETASGKRIIWANVLTLTSVMILIGVEVFGVAFAAAWALAGMFELSDLSRWAVMGTFAALGAYAMLGLWRLSASVEPVWG
jgi:hypothetical protein